MSEFNLVSGHDKNRNAKPITSEELQRKITQAQSQTPETNPIRDVDLQRKTGAITPDSTVDVYFNLGQERFRLANQNLAEVITGNELRCVQAQSPATCEQWGLNTVAENHFLRLLGDAYERSPAQRLSELAKENPEANFYLSPKAIPLVRGALNLVGDRFKINQTLQETLKTSKPQGYQKLDLGEIGTQPKEWENWLFPQLFPELHQEPTYSPDMTRAQRNVLNSERVAKIATAREQIRAILANFQEVAHQKNWIDKRFQYAMPAMDPSGLNLLRSLGLIKN